MKWNSIVFIIGFIIAFAGGYFFFGTSSSPDQNEEAVTEKTSTSDEETEVEAVTIADEDLAVSRNGCLGCHAVEALEIPGGTVGPDLSKVYSEMENKHGKDLDSFLQEPTSAVMATVIDDKPLDNEEREEIIKILKRASETDKQESDDK